MAEFRELGKTNILEKKECSALILCCSDFRFLEPLFKFLKEGLAILEFDLLSSNGGIKNLSNPLRPGWKELVLENIRTSKKNHNIKKIIIASHFDCLTFGGSKLFSTSEQEKNFHQTELEKAKKVIEGDRELSDLEIISIYIHQKDEGIEFVQFEAEESAPTQ